MRLVTKLSTVLLLCLLQPVSSDAQQNDDFEAFGAQIDKQFAAQERRIDDIFDAVDKAINDAMNGVTKRIIVKWPDGALPDRSRWVTYSDDLNTRAIADYEQGELVVETIIDESKPLEQQINSTLAMSQSIVTASSEELDQQDTLLKAINQEVAKVVDTQPPAADPFAKEPFAADPLESQVTPSPPQPTTPVKKAAIKEVLPKNTSVALQNLASVSQVGVIAEAVKVALQEPSEEMVQQPISEPKHEPIQAQSKSLSDNPQPSESSNHIVLEPAITTEPKVEAEPSESAVPVITVTKEQGVTKLVMKMAFINEYQANIIQSYLDEIKSYAARYDVPVSVVLAIIETESSFNPRAVSPIPAFGLMQLVPKTAGVDAHNLVFGEKKVVSPDFLFNEENNLHLGTAYFHLLTHRYLRKVNDPEARFYCAVASYNTGVGNLARTFTGKKSINAAVSTINKLSAQEVYDFLLVNLPAEETRNYLRKVVSRMQKYERFDA